MLLFLTLSDHVADVMLVVVCPMQYIAWETEYKITCDVCVSVCVSVCARTGFWGRISRKRLETTWYQGSTTRKWPMGNRLVT